MTNDGWGDKWPSNWKTNPSEPIKVIKQIWPKPNLKATDKAINEDWLIHEADKFGVEFWPKAPALTGLDLCTGERTILTKIENNIIKHQTELKSQGSNLVDNEQHLYFQCDSCNDILDPHTKSFQTLQEHRVNAGWKCIWNIDGLGYKVYCAKCGEKMK